MTDAFEDGEEIPLAHWQYVAEHGYRAPDTLTGTITATTAGPPTAVGNPTWYLTVEAIMPEPGTLTLRTDDNAICAYDLSEGYRSEGLVSLTLSNGRVLSFTQV